MNFRFKPLETSEFSNLFELDNLELEKIGATKMIVDEFPGFPCRVSLQALNLEKKLFYCHTNTIRCHTNTIRQIHLTKQVDQYL